MVNNSLKKNFALNLLNTLTGLLFPLVTFPYASRVLLADGIGQVQFFQSIIDYIALCTALGIPLYAVREIAKIRDDEKLRNKTTAEILLLHAILTFGGYLIVLILACIVTKIKVDIPLYLLLSTTLFFNAIGAAWFYQAIEDFKYITIRILIVRIISLISLFLFVKTKQDLLYYAGISVLANVGGNIFNFYRLNKYIDFRDLGFKKLSPWKHLRPALHIFVLNLIISFYVNLNSVMLGFIKNEQSVGYFTAATRLTTSILGIASSFGVVLLPRFSNLIGIGNIDEFKTLANKSISFTLALSLPLAIGLIFMASPIIHLFCGSNFEPSILTLQIVAPIILFIGLSGILGMQILYPQGQEQIVIISTAAGAVINFILNSLLIPKYAQYGAGFSTLIAEFLVTGVMIIFGKKYMPFKFITKQNFQYIVGTCLIILLLLVVKLFNFSENLYLLVGISLSVALYFIYLLLVNDMFILQIKNLIIDKMQKKI